MPLVVRAFPLSSSFDDLKKFGAELIARGAETDAFFRKYGVTHESWHVQETPNGRWVIAIDKLADPEEAAKRYGASSEPFDAWFKGRVLGLTGIDLNTTPLGPPTAEVFVWSDEAVPRSNLCR